MAYQKDTTDLTEILLECMGAADPMLHMLEWLCDQLMEAEVSSQIGARRMSKAQNVQATGVDIVPGAWILVWERCISWFPKCEMAATFPFL